LEEIMMCGDFQQEFLQLYEVHRESFRLEKTCKKKGRGILES